MERQIANPWSWGDAWSLNQGEVVSGLSRTLHCSGQVALVEDPSSEMGLAVAHEGDMAGQMKVALAGIDAILEKAGMTRANLLHLRFFTTDVDAFLAAYGVYAEWIGEAGIQPPQSLLGISRLVMPELMVEIEAVAGD